MDAPLLLSSEIALSLNQVKEFDQPALTNPDGCGMLIDEIRFSAIGSESNFGVGGMAIRATFRLGIHELTNVPVPIWNLGKSLMGSENLISPATGEPSPRRTVNTWRLPKPLYIPPGELLVPRAHYVPSLVAGAFDPQQQATVRVTYACRALPRGTPPPEVIRVPWVSFVQAPLIELDTANVSSYEFESMISDLSNPFEVPLHLERFIGRLVSSGVEDVNMTTTGRLYELYSSLLQARLTETSGRFSVRDPVPFGHLFQALDRSWEVRTVLPPKSSYRLYLEATGLEESGDDLDIYPCVSMVGYREVKVIR